MKITILALHLGFGGIEKFITNIANMFSIDNEVEIISVYKLYEKPSFEINSNVKITYLTENIKPNKEDFFRSLKSFNLFKILKEAFLSFKILYLKKQRMKQAIKNLKTDVVISTRYEHNILISKYCKKRIKKIATEHNYRIYDNKYIKKVVKSCENMDYLVVASKELNNFYSNKLKKCKTVNIPLCLDYIPEKISSLDKKSITYIGRLSREKGVLDLIEIFKIINLKHKDIILNIIGDGKLKNEVEKKIKEYKLEKNIIMHGFKKKKEIEKILLESSLGINTSYTESFGLAVLETFSYGIPCIAFDTAEGVNEIIDNGNNGYLIPNRDNIQMANKAVEVLNDKNKLKKFGEYARKKSLQYKINLIYCKWKKIL